jgi:hypothetical protein
MKQSDYIYENLKLHPCDKEIMLVLADALDEEGNQSLSNAYRWAAVNNRWPFERIVSSKNEDKEVKILDWESIERYKNNVNIYSRIKNTPIYALIPHELWKVIKDTPLTDKVYGGIHEAFVLLAMALDKTSHQL